jgi:hypothetical protein
METTIVSATAKKTLKENCIQLEVTTMEQLYVYIDPNKCYYCTTPIPPLSQKNIIELMSSSHSGDKVVPNGPISIVHGNRFQYNLPGWKYDPDDNNIICPACVIKIKIFKDIMKQNTNDFIHST